MEAPLSKTVIPAFCMAEAAIQRVLGENTFQWEQLDIEANDGSSQPPDTEAETHFTFCGHIATSENQFTILSSVRLVKDADNGWELAYAEVLCHPLGALQITDGCDTYTPVEGVTPYTIFENDSGDLRKVA